MTRLSCYGGSSFLDRKNDSSTLWPYFKYLPTTFGTMLFNWPSKFDELLMDDILVNKELAKGHFDEVVDRIKFVFNSAFIGEGFRDHELRLAYARVATRSIKQENRHQLPDSEIGMKIFNLFKFSVSESRIRMLS